LDHLVKPIAFILNAAFTGKVISSTLSGATGNPPSAFARQRQLRAWSKTDGRTVA